MMKTQKIKRMMCAAFAAMSLACAGTTAFAETIPFTVTVGGSGTQDPLSMKEIKTADGDNNAYFTGSTFNKATAGIYVRSYKKTDTSLMSNSAYLSGNNIGMTQVRAYNRTADGGVYYYMKATPATSRVTVTGYYCP